MISKHTVATLEGRVSDHEFEMLLRRSAESLKTAKPRLLKKVPLSRRHPASAA
jgi:hypothetical protein